jgi:hypothetical protein
VTLIADLSDGWPECTGAALVAAGFAGAVGYTGCQDTRKNVSAERVTDWLDSGLEVALVIENGQTDMLGGAKAGAELGQDWLAGAKVAGYDYARCIGFTAADWHTTPDQFETVTEAFDAFASYVPVAGLYGSGPMLDYLAAHSPAAGYWNSSSSSYGPPSASRNLQQLVAPGPHGLPVDINVVIRTPLNFMGENMPLTPADVALIWGAEIPVWGSATEQQTAFFALAKAAGLVIPPATVELTPEQIAAIAAAVAPAVVAALKFPNYTPVAES